jgi:hypothetical protein
MISGNFERGRFAQVLRATATLLGGDQRVREDLEPVFVRHRVDVVFSGHDHVYERTAPITAPIKGITYVVSGGGGRRLYPAGKDKWTASSVSKHHVVFVRVGGGLLSHSLSSSSRTRG